MPERVYTNRYEIVRHLASGGMAEVYLAHDQLLDRRVALKVLFPEYARDPAFVQRFRREAQSAANLNHPNIVAVFDWGEDAGTYFIVMEYVEGRSLRDAIHADGPLYPNLAADLASDIAGALGFAHRNGVVHRDVKPGNILLTPQGQVKVADFGIARAGGASEGLTQTGSVMGTATYFSPEQAQGLPVDARSDVYSLGVVLYEMVCAVPPFSGDSPIAVAYKHVREEPPRPTVVNPDVPRELEEIILTALGKTPEERYPSADDLRADLARFRRGEQPNAVPGLVVPAVPVSGTEPTTVTPRAVDHTRMGTAVAPVAPPPQKKRSAWPFVLALVALLAVLAGLGYLLADQLQGDGGGGTVTVDDYVGLTLDKATLLIERAGLEANPTFEINDRVPENEVFKQDPEPGTKVDKGDPVKLTVSQGRGKVAVPDVSGQSLADAESRLEDAGFEVDVRQETSATVEKGKVIRTDPAANMQIERGSEVVVFVSSGVELVKVPDVTGQDAVSAANQLGSAGFKVERVTEPSDTVETDTVIRTDPAAGTDAPKGSTVQLVISSGQQQVRVPSVVGLTQSEATAVLQDAGFQVATQEVTTLDPTRSGRVISQSPSAGTQAGKGSTVTITVGRLGSAPTATTTTTTNQGGGGGLIPPG
ncbi:MAG: Stk1 family PASTA domain-containing Ser/Thr kinase [Actinomycetota bacterium]|nr:Stk1 family PASTA domain-containing Ser/Thr kinase [Actinomycetota bacterium]